MEFFQAWELWGEGRGLELIDPTLGDLNHTDQVLRCIHVGLFCIQESPIDRPVMLDVIFMIYIMKLISYLHQNNQRFTFEGIRQREKL